MARPTTYLDLHLDIDSEDQLRTKLNEKGQDFNFPMMNFPAAPAYGVYLFLLI
jgi:hypothetical protein